MYLGRGSQRTTSAVNLHLSPCVTSELSGLSPAFFEASLGVLELAKWLHWVGASPRNLAVSTSKHWD